MDVAPALLRRLDKWGKVNFSFHIDAKQSEKGKCQRFLNFLSIYYVQGKRKQSQRELRFLTTYNMADAGRSWRKLARKEVGHKAKDFIKSCTFGGLECDTDYG